MQSTPGRPHEPTIHPRTRPEASDYALKNRLTNDWFRHDAHTLASAPNADIVSQHRAKKSSPATGEWLVHDPTVTEQPLPNRRCRTSESKAAHDRICGREEAWYKHEDNRHYVDPLPCDRGTPAAKEIKDKYATSMNTTMSWYKHQNEAPTDVQKCRLVGSMAREIGEKSQGKAGTPEWFEHKPEPSGEDAMLKTRLPSRDGQRNCELDRGCHEDWYHHENRSQSQTPANIVPAYRVTSKDGAEIAAKLSGESEKWYEHSQHKPDAAGCESRKGSAQFRRQSSDGVQRILSSTAASSDKEDRSMNGSKMRLRPDVQEFAIQSRAGLVGAVLDQNSSIDCGAPALCPRTVKPEAMATFDKNKGCMDEFMQGYLPPPDTYAVHRAKPKDPSLVQKHSGSGMEKTLKGSLPSDRSYHGRVRPEGEGYAERNRGTVQTLMNDNTNVVATDSSAHCRLRTEAAMDIARKYHGSVGNLLC